jgi:hypothetical protein
VKLTRAAVAATASVLLTLTACSSSDSLDSGSDETTSDSAESTESAPAPDEGESPEEAEGETSQADGTVTQAAWLDSVTEAQLDAQSARMEMEMDVAGQTVTMSGVVRGAEELTESAMQMEMEVPGAGQAGSIEMILLDGTLYMNMGSLTQGKYVTLDLDDPSAEQFFGGLQSQVNLAETTRMLEDSITSFEEAGSETVDGVETTKYVVTVDTEKFFDQQGGLGELPPSVDVPDSLTYTYWVDDEDLPVRVTTDMGGLGAMDMSFSDWGEPVEIEAPPAGQISKQNPFQAPAA